MTIYCLYKATISSSYASKKNLRLNFFIFGRSLASYMHTQSLPAIFLFGFFHPSFAWLWLASWGLIACSKLEVRIQKEPS